MTIMKYIFLYLGISTYCVNVVLGRVHCDACFNTVCHSKEPIFQEYPISGQIAVDRRDNIVYFHYEDDHKIDHTLGFDIDDIRFVYIPDIQFSFARTVDQKTSDVYIGGTHGIFKYNPRTNETIQVGLNDKTIWHMQYKDKVFYTTFMTKGLFTLEKKTKNIAPLANYFIDDFIVDTNDDIYFLSNFTMYVLKKGEKKPTVFSNVIYSLATDINGVAYFAQKENRGLYKIDSNTGRMTEVGAFAGSPFKIVFDTYNNLIYYDSDSEKLFYLNPTFAKCKVTNEFRGRMLRKKVGISL